ncbi:YybH family protein [Aurantibacillus circumpalustris]|uniref:YybH family protein n=1 Tax=Aurantibacillus circumpalustris TaxID=3036359 RepID=UPI00295A8071|nr:SgcJ/EcaC family oxidoreductase [Aurantibacillus circumpalustris]
MKKIIVPVCLLLMLASCRDSKENKSFINNQNQPEMNATTEKSAIEKLLFSYRDALNASDVSKILTLYSQDGVFMPTNAPSAKGQAQIKDSYEFVFKTIQLNIEFLIDEIRIDGSHAFAVTSSKGTTLIHANGQTVAEENRELFVLAKEDSGWKIARYMFNKTK